MTRRGRATAVRVERLSDLTVDAALARARARGCTCTPAVTVKAPLFLVRHEHRCPVLRGPGRCASHRKATP